MTYLLACQLHTQLQLDFSMKNDTLFLLWISLYSIVSSHTFAVICDAQNVLYRSSLVTICNCFTSALYYC